jgi:lysophospholipase L1-like esterase
MSRASTARRIVATAAYSGGGAVGVLGGAVGFLWAQSLLARRRVGVPRGKPFVTDGRYFADGSVVPAGAVLPDPRIAGGSAGPACGPGTLVRLVVLGDSGAAGLGASAPGETPGARLASELATATDRAVDLVSLAVVGAQSSALPEQVGSAMTSFDEGPPDVALIMIGANDVTHRVRPQVSVRYLDEAVRTLVGSGCGVVVACCPDLGTVQPVPNPLRVIGRWASRTLAAAQALATHNAGGRPVELGAILGPEFSAAPGEYFSEDRFHPSSVGYRRAAEVIMPELLEAFLQRGAVPATAAYGPSAAGTASQLGEEIPADVPGTQRRRDNGIGAGIGGSADGTLVAAEGDGSVAVGSGPENR